MRSRNFANRREFLRLTALGAAGAAVLAACGPAAAPSPTAAPAKPTEAPKAAATTAPAAAAPSPTTAAAAKPTEAAKPTVAAKPAASGKNVTIRLHMRAGGEKSEPAIYVQRPAEWEQETGYKLKLEPIPGGQDYVPKIVTLAAGGSIGDALFTGDSYSEHTYLVRKGVIEPVDDYLPKYGIKKDEWFKAIIDTLTYNGKMYGLPKASNPAESYIAINFKMMDDAGIKRPEVYGATFDQVREWAVKLSKGPADKREVYGFRLVNNNNQSVTNVVRQFGGDLIDKDGTKSLVDQQPFRDYLNWAYGLIMKDKVHPSADVVSSDGNQLAAMFAAGKLAMAHFHRAWLRPFRAAVGNKFEWGTIQFPHPANARGWVSNVDTHSGSSASKQKEEAFTLIKALSDRRFAYLVAKDSGYLTGRVDNLEAIKELADDPFIQLQQKCTEQEEPWWRAKNLRAYEVESALINNLDLLWLGKRQPDDSFIKDLKEAIDTVLAKPSAE